METCSYKERGPEVSLYVNSHGQAAWRKDKAEKDGAEGACIQSKICKL